MSFHKKVSYVKSFIRIIGYSFVPFNLIVGAGLLILAELIGVVEERDEK